MVNRDLNMGDKNNPSADNRKHDVLVVNTRPSCTDIEYDIKEHHNSDIEDIHDVSLLLPPIEQHSSAKKLDQMTLDDKGGSMPRCGEGRQRRHTICTTKSNGVLQIVRERVRAKYDLERIVTLNCSGEEYQIRVKQLVKYPDTLLGSEELEQFYCPELQCYFFDRNRQFFEHIIQYYQCGRLNIPREFDWSVVKVELAYFRIHDKQWGEEGSAESGTEDHERGINSVGDVAGGMRGCSPFRRDLYLFLNNPKHSRAAMLYNFVDVILVSLALFIMMLETDMYLVKNTNTNSDVKLDFRVVRVVDNFLMLFFTVDLVLRIVSWPSHKQCSYFKDPMNIVDLVAVSPYYVSHMAEVSNRDDMEMVAVLRATRLLRMVRIFRFVRHSEDLFQIIRFVYQTRNQLGIIYIFSNLIVLLVGAVMFYAEGRPQFDSILASCWWSLVTLFAVGYGDNVPRTLQGCIVATIAVVVGMVIITLPITIVVGKFAEWHGVHKTREKRGRGAERGKRERRRGSQKQRSATGIGRSIN